MPALEVVLGPAFQPLGKGLSQSSGVDGSSGPAVNFPPVRGDLMILSAIAEKLKRRSKDDFKGRHFEAPLIYWLCIP